jgi:hypothetical protein
MTPTSVTVTGTLVDSEGTKWTDATLIVHLVPGFGTPITEYKWGGTTFVKRHVIPITDGTFSINLPSNGTIIPVDSMWKFTISGHATSPAAVFTKTLNYASGSTQDVSAMFTAAAPPLEPQVVTMGWATSASLDAATPIPAPPEEPEPPEDEGVI